MLVTSKFLNLLKRIETLFVFEKLVLKGLIVKHIKIVRNSILATLIVSIIVKLTYALKNSYFLGIERKGKSITISMSEKAFSSGNREALNWIKDKNFKRYLGLISCYRHECGPDCMSLVKSQQWKYCSSINTRNEN